MRIAAFSLGADDVIIEPCPDEELLARLNVWVPPGLRSRRVARFDHLDATEPSSRVVLDIRDGWELDSGHHADALHVPFHELPDRLRAAD